MKWVSTKRKRLLSAVCALRRRVVGVIGHADRTGPLRITAPVCCYRASARASSRCADSAGANGGAASVVTALRRSGDLVGCGNVDQGARTGAAAFGTSWRTRHCALQPAVSSSPNGRRFPCRGRGRVYDVVILDRIPVRSEHLEAWPGLSGPSSSSLQSHHKEHVMPATSAGMTLRVDST